MSDQPPRTADAARLIVEELEEVCAEEERLAEETRILRLRRQRLVAALNPVLSDLPKAQADWLRERRARALNARVLAGAREQKSKFAAILDYLARHGEEDVKVAEITRHLNRSGFEDLKRTYVSDTLRRFERHGIVAKVRHGRYEVNEHHRDIIQHQLRWLEGEVRRERAAVWRRMRGR